MDIVRTSMEVVVKVDTRDPENLEGKLHARKLQLLLVCGDA